MIDSVHESARDVPVIGEYDVVVVGGGVAGVAAAVSAARNGASTLLVENHCVLGGLATEGLIAIYLPICDGRGNQVMGGLTEEMLHLTALNAPAEIPACWLGAGTVQQRSDKRFLSEFAPQPYMLALEDFASQAGVKFAYDTRLCGADCDGGKIKAIIVENKTGRCAIRAKAFIDASGDADLCARAGEPTKTHRDNARSSWFVAYDGQKLSLVAHGANYVNLPTSEKSFAGDNHQDITDMLLSSRPMVMEKIRQMRLEQKNDAIYPALISTIPEFRVTRCLAGTMELDSAHNHQWFDDAIALAGDWRQSGPVYAVPYRCIVAPGLANLLVAGRCISSTRGGAEVTRAIPVCVATGQSAGAAAASVARSGSDARGLDVPVLQRTLADQGVILEKSLLAGQD
jgi:hypothetical protein